MRRAAALVLCLASPAFAQEPAPRLEVELNAADPVEGGCRLSFVAQNQLGADLRALVFETVLFGRDQQVRQLTLLDFRDLPQDRLRVRQFDVPGIACDDLGRILLNAAATCDGAGLDPAACMAGLVPQSRLDMELAG